MPQKSSTEIPDRKTSGEIRVLVSQKGSVETQHAFRMTAESSTTVSIHIGKRTINLPKIRVKLFSIFLREGAAERVPLRGCR